MNHSNIPMGQLAGQMSMAAGLTQEAARNAAMRAPEPPPSHMQQQMRELDAGIDQLRSNIIMLEERLQPVMRAEPSNEMCVKESSSQLCPLAEALVTQNKRILLLNQSISTMLYLLEV